MTRRLESLKASLLQARPGLRQSLLFLALVAASGIFVWRVHIFYPVQHWLTWRYLFYWFAALAWTTSGLAIGLVILRLLKIPAGSWAEQAVHALGTGIVIWFLLLFCLGRLGQFNAAAAITLPVLLLAAGGRDLYRFVRRRIRALRRARARWGSPRIGIIQWLVLGYGCGALLFLYLSLVHPENTAYDARWYHLGLAEQYVADGRLSRFVEGWHLGAFPHLASLVFTWAYLLPGLRLFDQVELCSHIELIVFLWTLFGIVCVVRRLVPGLPARLSWVALFLFPGIFLYDSGLHLTSDHFAAFWAPPIFLTFARIWRGRDWQGPLSRATLAPWLLLCIAAAGALLTKYSVTCLLAFIALGLCVKLVRASVKAFSLRSSASPWIRLGRVWCGPGVLLLGGLVLTAPHWLKNWVWYGNPVYPYAYKLFQGRPWEPYPSTVFTTWWSTHPWAPRGPLLERAKDTLEVFATFSFVPHDWPRFHGMVPIFGSLFTLCTILLPFVSTSRRVWALAGATYVGVAVWFSGMQFDRYLQVLLPWMTAFVAVVLIRVWQQGSRPVRVAVCCMVGAQAIWGLDVWSLPAHAMLHKPPITLLPELAVSGYHERLEERFHVFEPYRTIGKNLEPDARILLHNHHLRVGLKASIVSDAVHLQSGLDYGTLATPHRVYEKLKSFGVTHILIPQAGITIYNSFAFDLVFEHFRARHSEPPKAYGSFSLAKLKQAPPVEKSTGIVSYFGCVGGYKWGNYSLAAMNFPHAVVPDLSAYPPALKLEDQEHSAKTLISEADYVVHSASCRKRMPPGWTASFRRVLQREGNDLWVRRSLLGPNKSK